MKDQRRDPLEPKSYLSDMSPPHWELEKQIYVNEQLWRRFNKFKSGAALDCNATKEVDSPQRFLSSVIQSWSAIDILPIAEQNEINFLSMEVTGVAVARELSPFKYLIEDSKQQPKSDEEVFFSTIVNGISFKLGHGWVFPAAAENLVITAVRQLGADCIGPVMREHLVYEGGGKTRLRQLPLNQKLRILVSGVIQAWRYQVIYGDQQVRQHAVARLQELGRALIPDTRGRTKKGKPIFRSDVRNYYWETLFRLYHVRHALSSTPGTRKAKIRAASELFEFSVEDIRDFFGLNDAGEVERRSGPFTTKDMARELTARHFGITQHTVSNIISS